MKMLELSKFQKIKEDKNKTMLQHKDGHTMTILHTALPKIQREQLKRLKMADGGQVKNFDDGGDTSSDQTPDSSQNATPTSPAAPATTININAAPAPAAPVAAPAPVAGQPPGPPQNPAAQLAQIPNNINIPTVPPPASNIGSNGTMNPAGVAKNTQTAAVAQGNLNSAQNQGVANLEQNYINQRGQTAQIDQQNLNNIAGHVDDFNRYIQSNQVNPNAYVENMDAGKKVSTAIGLILGGLGGKGVNNPAMDFLNKQIDRDIQAQKDRMGQQKTIYDAYSKLYGDSVAANNATKASMLDIYTHQANQLAARIGTQSSQQAAMAFGANAAIEKSKLLQDAAVNLRNLPGYSATNTNPPSQQRIGGTPDVVNSSQASPTQSPSQNNYNEKNGYRTYPILAPNAVQSASGLTHVGYLNQPKLQSQLTAADQVDKVLNGPERDGVGGIHDLLQDMYEDTGKGAYIPSAATQIGTGAANIPYVGGAIEGGLGLLGMSGYNDFMRKRTNMISDLSTALNGLVAPTDIVKLVDENLPKGGDTQESMETAERQIVNGIKKALPTDELQKAGLLAKTHKRK
jgi:hypothetical protein